MDTSLLALLSPEDIVLDLRPRLALKPHKRGQRDNAKRQYFGVFRGIKPGIQEIIVHLGYDDFELRSIMVDHPDFWAPWRQRDFEIANSPEFKQALVDNHIRLITLKS